MPPPCAVAPFAWLSLTVQPVSDSTLFSQLIPPPRAANRESTRLLLITESVSVALPPVVLMPPPLDVAWLSLMVLLATFSVPWLAMPPPTLAVFVLTVLPVRVVEPREALYRPPPDPVAALPLTVELVRLVVPKKLTPRMTRPL